MKIEGELFMLLLFYSKFRQITYGLFLLFVMIHSPKCYAEEGQTLNVKQSIVVAAEWGREQQEIGRVPFEPELKVRINSINPIAVDSKGDIYIGDSINYKIKKFSSAGRFMFEISFAGQGEKPTIQPRIPAIAVDKGDNLYTIFTQRKEIAKFNRNGKLIALLSLDELDKFHGNDHAPVTINKNKFVNNLKRMLVDSLGNIYILGGDGNLVKLNSEGRVLKIWSPHATNAMNFLFLDTAGNLYIWYHSDYQRYDNKGDFIGEGLGLLKNIIVPFYQDSANNIYGFTPDKNQQNVHLALYSFKEKKIYKYPLSLEDVVSVHWTIDSIGNVYYTDTTGDAFKVFKVSIAP